MGIDWNQELLYIFQLLLAAGCGLLIGFERQSRTKMAGIRTHIMVSLASCLMMIISKYGFMDVITINGISVDASRVAAGIITGMGILGGGLILTGKQGFVSGVTTAAGVWATVGVGMAIGSQMYILGCAATLFILAVQILFHRNIKMAGVSWRGTIVAECDRNPDAINGLLQELAEKKVEVTRSKCDFKGENRCVLHLMVNISPKYSREQIVNLLGEMPQINTFEI